MLIASSLESIRLKNFQAIRDEVEIPIKPLTFLYGPNSAGKSSVMDALVCLREWVNSPKNDAQRWIRKEGVNSSPDQGEMIVGATFMAYGSPAATVLFPLELCSQLPECFTACENGESPEWWPGESRLLEIRVTSIYPRPESGISKLELFIDRNLAFDCELDEDASGDEEHFTVKISPAFFGERVCDFLNQFDESTLFKIPIELRLGPLRFRRRYLDEVSGEAEAVLLGLCNLLIGVTGRCLDQTEGSVATADRGLIRDGELTLVKPKYHWDKDAPQVALERLGLKADPHEAIRAIANSFLQGEPQRIASKKKQSKKEKALEKAFEAVVPAWIDARNSGLGNGGPSDETLLYFVNRCLSDHLFIDQGYQITVDVLELTRADLDDPIKTKSRKSKNQTNDERVAGQVVICFLVDKMARRLTFEDVGTGISCVVPVLCKLHGEFSFCQQPELHLHPALQSALGDVLVERAQFPALRHIVETHSEYLLLRCLRRIRETTQGNRLAETGIRLTTDQIAVLYFDPQPDGATKVREIRVSADGDFIDHWPRGFFQERGKDLFDE